MLGIPSASVAFDLHTNLIEHRRSNPEIDRLLYHGYYSAFVGGASEDSISRAHLEVLMEKSKTYRGVARTLDDAILTRADTVYLTDDLRELVRSAEETMPDEVLFNTDVYTPCGLILMETPLQMDIQSRMKADELDEIIGLALERGGTIIGERLNGEPDEYNNYRGVEHWEVRGFAWADVNSIKAEALSDIDKRFGVGSEESLFARDVFIPSDIDKGMYLRVYGCLTATTIDGVMIDIPELARLKPLGLVDIYTFLYGEDGIEQEKAYYAPKGDSDDMLSSSWERSRSVRRFILALFRLMDEYVDVDKSSLHRAHGRRATRSGRIGDVKNVTVLSLRRALGDDEDGSGTGRKVTLAHLVRGHWRNQWYPSQNMHRAKWIRAHRRGGNVGDEVIERPRIIKVDR
jgi:hypothetical protein